MVYTKEEFYDLWHAEYCPITFDDCADCAKAWGLCSNPRCHDIIEIRDMVVKAAEEIAPKHYNDVCDGWRVLSDDGKRTVLKDEFATREEASDWARKNVKAYSWLIEGYRYSCVINFKERDFNAADNLY